MQTGPAEHARKNGSQAAEEKRVDEKYREQEEKRKKDRIVAREKAQLLLDGAECLPFDN